MEQQRQIHVDTLIYEINTRLTILRETLMAREKQVEELQAQLPKQEKPNDDSPAAG